MRKVTFVGRVIPEILKVSAPTQPMLKYSEPSGLEATLSIEVKDSVVRVEALVTRDSDEDVQTAMVRALGMARALVDVVAFTKGWALHVVIDELQEGDERLPLALSEARVRPLCTAYSVEAGFEEVADLVMTDLKLRFAFHDLVSGVGTENYCVIGCGRAMDALRHLIAGSTMGEKKGWAVLRETLNVSEAYLKFVTNASQAPRHGDRGAADGPTHLEAMLRAWSVMNRFLEYKKRNDGPLPLAEFPMLG